ncbi:Protein CBG10183 [Caenorhabditis briggsae]|uniref:Protein CBG10183 n=1 Tax=Caenorhabditis briggsae TaxID=6238 RepID=A8XAV8_CAEBR|nr:Protein CBG10183 [Caenorhabditis briggsae]CAP29773.1 Protein CBG10183 [Caenorhabditis briggsae]
MNGQIFPFLRLPTDLCSEILKTMDYQEIISYSLLSKKALSMIKALQLPISYVQIRMDAQLTRVPLDENISLQHIGTANLKDLQLYYQNDLNLVEICSWNFESCMINIRIDQLSLRDLNRFFKMWVQGSNPKLKELYILCGTQIILIKGLKIEEETEEQGEKKFMIRNVRGIGAEISVLVLKSILTPLSGYVDVGKATVLLSNRKLDFALTYLLFLSNMDGQKFPFRRLSNDICLKVLKTIDLHEM